MTCSIYAIRVFFRIGNRFWLGSTFLEITPCRFYRIGMADKPSVKFLNSHTNHAVRICNATILRHYFSALLHLGEKFPTLFLTVAVA